MGHYVVSYRSRFADGTESPVMQVTFEAEGVADAEARFLKLFRQCFGSEMSAAVVSCRPGMTPQYEAACVA